MNEKIKVGITGGIGAGKSIVCSIIHTMGYPVFYSDIAAKNILNTNPEVISQIINLFGEEAYLNGYLNRKFIADKIFNNQSLLTAINLIVHPAVRKSFDDWAKNRSSRIVFNEAAILFETDGYKNFDATVLVTAPKNVRISRVMKRDSVLAVDVEKRMAKQWSDERKADLADYIIVNDETEMLIPQVISVLKQL